VDRVRTCGEGIVTASERLAKLCERHGVLAVYLFGSRADDGLEILAGRPVAGGGSDLDVGLVFELPSHPLAVADLQVAFEDLMAPMRVDLVPLRRLDPLFQFAAISGHRVAATDPTRADEYELEVMRMASELLPVQRRLDLDLFGVTRR
jgi:predicted nucleotidyltransferase